MEFTPLLETLTQFIPSSDLTVKKPAPQKILLISPHPDDECIVGSLALRLQLENKAQVICVAVTLGSKVERQKGRLQELKNACGLLGFKLEVLSPVWKLKEKELKALILKHKPSLILAPHIKDRHPVHIKSGELLKTVLLSLKKFSVIVAWDEFWAQMSKPNLLVEVPSKLLDKQMRALAMHVGEVERNPYHLRLPAWMMDNVRRGAEVVGGKGAESPKFAFGVIYQIQKFEDGKFKTPKVPAFLTGADDLSDFLKSLN